MPGHRLAGEGVADDQVVGVGRQVLEGEAGVAREDVETGGVVERQLVPGDVDQPVVDLEGQLGRARPDRRQVPGQGESASADVQGVDRARR